MTEAEAIEAAKRFITKRTDSYPIMPLDDFGNVDLEAYEPGSTPWNLLEEFEILDTEVGIDPTDDSYYGIRVYIAWKWSEDEEAEDDVCFEVYIPKDSEDDREFDFERVS